MFYKLDIIILYSKQNNIILWLFGDTEFLSSCSTWYLIREISNWTREEKFHISMQPFIILFII